MNKELTKYKENIFSKIKRIFLTFILKKEGKKAENKNIENKEIKNDFFSSIVIAHNGRENSLKNYMIKKK